MRKKGSEVWVGIFVVVGIILLALMTLKIERFQIGKDQGHRFHIYFDSAAGVERNSPVRVVGVNVGNIEKVALVKGKARVTFRIPSDVILHKDAKAYLKTEGFLGEKYVEISPGTMETPRLEPEGVVEQGAPPFDMDQILSKMGAIGDIGEDIRNITKPLGDVLKAVDAKKVEGMIDHFNTFSSQLTTLAKDSKETIQKARDAFSHVEDIGEKVKRGEGSLGKLISDETIYREAKETVETAKEAAESAKKTANALKNVSEKIERGEGTLGKLIYDESFYQEAKKTFETAKEAAESTKKTVDVLKNVSEKIERGEGTLGKLVHDETLYQDARETVRTAKEAVQSAKDAIESVKGITEKVERGEGTLGKLVKDDKLMKEAEKTMKKVQRAAEGIEEQTPISVLGTIFGIFF